MHTRLRIHESAYKNCRAHWPGITIDESAASTKARANQPQPFPSVSARRQNIWGITIYLDKSGSEARTRGEADTQKRRCRRRKKGAAYKQCCAKTRTKRFLIFNYKPTAPFLLGFFTFS